MSQCIFCRIVAGELPAEVVYRDDLVTAFRDIKPVMPVHILIVPNQHFDSLSALDPADETLPGRMLSVARKLAHELGVAPEGYRIQINTGPNGGQTVYHLHMQLIGGQRTRYPVG